MAFSHRIPTFRCCGTTGLQAIGNVGWHQLPNVSTLTPSDTRSLPVRYILDDTDWKKLGVFIQKADTLS